jgi:hypothetical protein
MEDKSEKRKKEVEEVKKDYNEASKYDNIEEELIDLRKRMEVYRFNPDKRSLSDLHDILDDIQQYQSDAAKKKMKILKEETLINLSVIELEEIYEKESDQILDGIRGKDDDFSNLKEKEVHIRVELLYISNEKRFFEKRKIGIRDYLNRINVMIEVTNEMDNKVQQKIKLMQLQQSLGVLVSYSVGKNKEK